MEGITEKDQAEFENYCRGLNMQQDYEHDKMEVIKNGGCPKCGGTGWITTYDSVDAPFGSGKCSMPSSEPCECWASDNAHCPYCGSLDMQWYNDEKDARCLTCGWNSND